MIEIEKKQSKIKWIDISNDANGREVKAWMQVCDDYSTNYEYNWKADFLESFGDGESTTFDVSSLESGDIVKVSGGTSDERDLLYAEVIDNSQEDRLIIEDVGKDRAIDRLRSEEDDLQSEVLNKVEKADLDDLEVINAKLNEILS
jgi:hypothetical protein